MRTAEEILLVLGSAGVTTTLRALGDEAPALAAPTKSIWLYAQVALAIGPDPRFADEACVSMLVQCVLAAGGEWSDVEQLLGQHEPLLDEFLDPWHARVQWQVHGGELPVFDEAVAA